MQDTREVNPHKPELPAALQGLELAPLRSSPRAIWYQAGFEAGRRQANWWRAAAALVVIGSGALAAWNYSVPRNSPTFAKIPQSTPWISPATEDASTANAAAAYAQLRDGLVQQGLDALSAQGPAAVDPGTFAPSGWYPHNNGG
jgi:hypothetical protein